MRIKSTLELGLWLVILGIPCSRALVEIGASLAIFSWLFEKWRARDLSLRQSSLLGPFTFFVLWAGLSVFWTHNVSLTLKAFFFQTLEYAALYLAVSDGLRDDSTLRRLIWLQLFWSSLMVGDGVIQLLHGTDLIRGYAPGLLAGGIRMTGAMKYPNDFAAYTSLGVLLGAGTALAEWRSKRWGWAMAAALIALANLAAVILTYSRGACLGLLVAGVVALFLYRTRYGLAFIVLAAIAVAFLPTIYLDRIAGMFNIQPGSSSEERLLVWKTCLIMIRQHPWVGFGLNSFNAMFHLYKVPGIWGTPYAHNCFLQLTVELGLIGLTAFLWMIWRLFSHAWQPASKQPSWERTVALSLIAAAAGYLIHSSSETHLYSLPLAVMWWTMLGLIDAFNGVAEDRQQLFRLKIRRLAAIRTDRLGDVLLNLPALKALKERFPGSHLTFLVQPGLRELFQGQPGIDAVEPYRPAYARGPWGTLRWAWRLRHKRYDAAVILNPTRPAHCATFLSGIPIRVGFARKWDFLLTDTLPDRKAHQGKHEVDYNLELVGLLGARTHETAPRLVIDPKDEEALGPLLLTAGIDPQRAIIAIHPWTSHPSKQWPLNSIVKLMDLLNLEEKVTLVLIGGPEEAAGAKDLLSGVHFSVVNFVGQLSLKGLAAFLKQCCLLISNDSGPVHVAAAIGTPTVVISPREHAAQMGRWAPRGAGHTILLSPTPEEVASVVFKKLQQHPSLRERP